MSLAAPVCLRMLAQVLTPLGLAVAIVWTEPVDARFTVARGMLVGALGTIQLALATRWRRKRDVEEREDRENRVTVDLLTHVGHETRTNLNAILGMARLLMDSELDDARRDHVQTIRESAEALLVTLDDGLDAARLDAGALELEREVFDLDQCLDDVLEVHAPRAQERGIELCCLVKRDVPVRLLGDGPRVQRMLFHMVSNAIRCTHEGSVEVEAGASVGVDEVELSVCVRDTGIGIETGRRATLFESHGDIPTVPRFGKATSGGSLAVSRRLAQEMGGDLVLESTRVGRGSSFRMTVCLGLPANPGATVSAPALAGAKVLIVDASGPARRVAREILEAEGAECAERTEGRSALDALREAARTGRPFDLALVSERLPGMSGERLIARLARTGSAEQTRVVWVTDGSNSARQRARAAVHQVATVTKPLRRAALTRAAALADRRGSAPKVETASPGGQPRLDVLLVEDDLANQKAVKLGLQRFPCDVDVACHGDEVAQALTLKRYDVVLMDCRVPLRAGLGAIGRVRELHAEGRREIPILGLAPSCTPAEIARCTEAGMSAVIRTPARPERLWTAIEAWAQHARGAALAGDAPTGDEGDADAPDLDRTALAELREHAGDDALFGELVELFLRDTPGHLEAIEAAAAAEDWRQVEQVSRNLRSSCAHLGAVALAELCEALGGPAARDGTPELLPRAREAFEAVRAELESALDDGAAG